MSGRNSSPIITATAVTRSYGQGRGLAGVDLTVEAAEIVAILGPNGAGKTTLVEILEGLRYRDDGHVQVLGQDPEHADRHFRSRIGAVLQLGTETDEFTVSEMLRAHSAYYPAPLPMSEVVDLLDLAELLDQRVSRLSGGQRRRLDIALGIVGDPELLFLDEPTTGLDPEVRRTIWRLIRRLADNGTTVVLTTHYLDEVEHLADRTIVLIAGAVVWEGPTSGLTDDSGHSVVKFRLRPPTAISDLPPCLGQPKALSNNLVSFETNEPGPLVAELMAWANEQPDGAPIEQLQIGRPSLEDAYLNLLQTAHTESEPRA